MQHPDTLDLYHVMVIPFQIEDLCQEYTLSLKCMCLIPSRTPRAATADPRELRTSGSQRRKVFPSGLQEVLFLQPRPSDCSCHPSLSTQLLHPQRCLPEKWPFIFPCALVHNPLSCLCQKSHAKQLDININVSAAPTTSVTQPQPVNSSLHNYSLQQLDLFSIIGNLRTPILNMLRCGTISECYSLRLRSANGGVLFHTDLQKGLFRVLLPISSG